MSGKIVGEQFGAPDPVPSNGQAAPAEPHVVAAKAPEKMAVNKIQCDACPVLCQISAGRLGACDRWGNVDGRLTREELKGTIYADHFDEIDTNKDGKIDPKEFRAYLKKLEDSKEKEKEKDKDKK